MENYFCLNNLEDYSNKKSFTGSPPHVRYKHAVMERSASSRSCGRREPNAGVSAVSYETIRFCVQDKNEVPLDLFALDDRPHLQIVRLPQPNLTVYTQYANSNCKRQGVQKIMAYPMFSTLSFGGYEHFFEFSSECFVLFACRQRRHAVVEQQTAQDRLHPFH